MKLSIVTTLYCSAPYIAEFHRRATAVAKAIAGNDYQIVMVNDGSPDESLALAIKLMEVDPNLVIVDLSRNFGHHKAMMTGLERAKGEITFLIDSDLEEEPEWLFEFLRELNQKDCDVVYGVQTRRKGKWFERHSGEWFYRLFKMLTGLRLPANAVTARLMKRPYVQALISHQEREVFMAGLWHITGFDQRAYGIKKHNTSETTYTFRKKLSLLVNSVTSFSNAPLISIFYIGLFISFFALSYITYLCINWLFLSKPLTGWTSVMASIWLLGGMIISFVGVVGIYLSKIFSETKRRPYTIVKKIYEREQS
ncbi:glycosyltransferase family 2 protein [Chitiniphilus shinanonensis]|uniref:glycosyltransferase family 2 protein n=1 Tax=Chitiniphilus shinanonensis TaxID=553088 RepID=UPI00333F2742